MRNVINGLAIVAAAVVIAAVLLWGGGNTVWFNDGRPRVEGNQTWNRVTISISPEFGDVEVGFRADGTVVWRKADIP